MKEWIVKYVYPTIAFIGGLLLGFYLAVLRYESSMEVIKEKIIEVKDNIHDIETLIQNRLLTKPGD